MDLQEKLTDWQRAGLITPAQAEAIGVYEQRGARPYLFYALGGLGAFAVAVGLVSLVAANWDEIPAAVKLGLDLLVALLLGAGIWRADARRSHFVREALLLVFFGLVLASIGLISQIYQLGGEAREALLLWAVITGPAMLRLRTGFGVTVWMVAVEGTWLWNIGDFIVRRAAHQSRESFWTVAAVVYLTCLGLAALGGVPALRRRRPELAQAAGGLGAAQLVLLATLAQQLWYGHIGARELAAISPLWVGAVLLCSAVAAAGVPTWLRAIDEAPAAPSAILGLRSFLIYAAVSATAPTLFEHRAVPVLAALSFLGLWGLLGWVGLKLRAYRLFQLATALLALRIIIIYFEVIGSLLSSGLGLISGGAITLLVAWVWRKKTLQVQDRLAHESATELAPAAPVPEGVDP